MESRVPLTRAQKWDLVRMSAAAIVSTIFFSIPVFLGRPHVAEQAVQPSDSRAETVTSGATAPEPVDTDAVANADSVRIVRSTTIAIVTKPDLQASMRRSSSPIVQANQRTDSPTPFRRRLARFLAGSGKYEVKPFPSVNTPGS